MGVAALTLIEAAGGKKVPVRPASMGEYVAAVFNHMICILSLTFNNSQLFSFSFLDCPIKQGLVFAKMSSL